MPFRLGSSTPKPSQARRSPSGDQAPPQKISTAGSGGARVRKAPVLGSMRCATFPSPQQLIWISVPSGDQRGFSEGPSRNSCCSSLPSGLMVYVTMFSVPPSPRLKTIRPSSAAAGADPVDGCSVGLTEPFSPPSHAASASIARDRNRRYDPPSGMISCSSSHASDSHERRVRLSGSFLSRARPSPIRGCRSSRRRSGRRRAPRAPRAARAPAWPGRPRPGPCSGAAS